MRHLKNFNSISKTNENLENTGIYDFGEYEIGGVGNYEHSDLLNLYKKLKHHIISCTDEDKDFLENELPGLTVRTRQGVIGLPFNPLSIEVYLNINGFNYTIFSLSDYCYLVVITMKSNLKKVAVLDGLDEVVRYIKESNFIVKNESISIVNETFDIYDFKTYQFDDVTIAEDVYTKMREFSKHLDMNGYIDIINEPSFINKVKIEYISGFLKGTLLGINVNKGFYFLVLYLGDYVYAITLIDKRTDYILKIIVCDDIGGLVKEINNIL